MMSWQSVRMPETPGVEQVSVPGANFALSPAVTLPCIEVPSAFQCLETDMSL